MKVDLSHIRRTEIIFVLKKKKKIIMKFAFTVYFAKIQCVHNHFTQNRAENE